MKVRRCSLLILMLLALLPAMGTAQETAETNADDAASAVIQIPPEHASARATMRTFLEAFDPSRPSPEGEPLAVAASCLDLSQIRETLRTRQGKELAVQLKEILDKTELIDIAAISDAPDAAPYELDIFDHGAIRIAPNAAGEWLFDAETLRAVPSLLAAVRERATVEGVTVVEPLTPAMWLRSTMPKSLLEMGFLMEHWQWLALLAVLLIALILDLLVAALCRNVVAGYLKERLEDVEEVRLKRALRPIGLLAAALFCWFALYWLGLPTGVLEVLQVAVHFTVATSFVWATYRVVDIASAVLEIRAARTGNKFDDLLVPLVSKTFKILVTAFGLVFIADTLRLPIRSILAGLGIGGLAIALAAQDMVKNLFGSFLVIMDRPFSVGDYVAVGSVSGTVEELGFRSTRIRTSQNSLVTLPNSHLITTAVDNLGARQYRRWRTTLGLTYDTPPDKIEAFCEGVRELIRQHPHTRKEGFQVVFNEFSASSLDIMLHLFFEVPDWGTELASRQQLGLDILRLAEELGVEMAFPTQTVHLHRGSQDPREA